MRVEKNAGEQGLEREGQETEKVRKQGGQRRLTAKEAVKEILLENGMRTTQNRRRHEACDGFV